MIDFETLKSLIINGQSVMQLAIDGRIVWKAYEPQPSNAYIETDGIASYMDLGFVPSNNCTYDISFKIPENAASGTLFSSVNSSNRARFRAYLSTAPQGMVLEFSNPNTAGGGNFDLSSGRHRLTYDLTNFNLDGNELAVQSSSHDTSETLYIGVNRRTMTDFANARFYYAKFWENGVLIRDLVPYSGPRGVGLLDRVNDVLYTNANTTGTLTYGIEEPWSGLKFTASQDGSTVKMVKVGSRAPDVSLEYSIDKGQTWQDFIVFSSSTSSDGTLVTLNAGNEL